MLELKKVMEGKQKYIHFMVHVDDIRVNQRFIKRNLDRKFDISRVSVVTRAKGVIMKVFLEKIKNDYKQTQDDCYCESSYARDMTCNFCVNNGII